MWKYSQQSWETLNNLVKTFYFGRTQRRGVCGYMGGRGKSKLKSIGRWLQRRNMFLCGFTNDELLKFYSQFQNDTDEEVIDDSSETCSLLDDIPMMNRDQLFFQPKEFNMYRNNEGEVIRRIV